MYAQFPWPPRLARPRTARPPAQSYLPQASRPTPTGGCRTAENLRCERRYAARPLRQDAKAVLPRSGSPHDGKAPASYLVRIERTDQLSPAEDDAAWRSARPDSRPWNLTFSVFVL